MSTPVPNPDPYQRALAVTLRFEGGLVDDPADPGGRTAYGVTQRTFDADCDTRKVPRRDVYSITAAEVAALYRTRFWEAAKAAMDGWALCLLVFDAAVNHGPARALEFRRQAATCLRYLDCRVAFYYHIVAGRPASKKYLKGWLARAETLRRIACPETTSLADLHQKALQ